MRHKRHKLLVAAGLTGLFLAGGGSTFVGLKQLENRQAALTLAEYSANALAEGKISEAVSQAMQAIPLGKEYFGSARDCTGSEGIDRCAGRI